MPLFKSASKKALQSNIKTEMDANPGKANRAQNLAIAYNTQARAKKKMAKGGMAAQGPTEGPQHDEHEMGVMCEHGGPEMCAMGCYAEGGEPIAGSEAPNMRKMAYGGSAVRATQEPGVSARKPDDMRLPAEDYLNKNWTGDEGHTPRVSTSMGPSKEEYDAEMWAAEGGEINDDVSFTDAEEDERPVSIADAIMRKRKRMADGGMVDINENAQESGQTPYSRMNGTAYSKELYDDNQLSENPFDFLGEKRAAEAADAAKDEEDINDGSIVSKIRAKMKAKRG